MEKKTNCECPLAGYYNRHSVQKTAHMHKLCQNHKGYFDLWEECKGPGQEADDCEKKSHKQEIEEKKPNQEEIVKTKPSKFQMAKNSAKATTKHVVSGGRNVSPEVQKERMEICAGTETTPACEYYDADANRCRDCGCFLAIKTKWKTSTCPQNKW